MPPAASTPQSTQTQPTQPTEATEPTQQQTPAQQQAAVAPAVAPTTALSKLSTRFWTSTLDICTALVGLAFTIAATVWAVKAYNTAVLANQLSQKESCRAHPNNPFLQTSKLCREMREAGDYDRLSERGITSPTSSTEYLTVTKVVWSMIVDDFPLMRYIFLAMYTMFLGCFCLPMSWSERSKVAMFVLRCILYTKVLAVVEICLDLYKFPPSLLYISVVLTWLVAAGDIYLNEFIRNKFIGKKRSSSMKGSEEGEALI